LQPLKRVAPTFYKHLFKSEPFIAALQSTTDSLRDGKSITFEQFGAIPIILPDEDEQTQIAKFLDHETAKIDRLIEKQQELIALLKEKRQAVISHAVTKGLNPNGPMKDSEVEWLGEIPEHWSFGPLKRFWDVIYCRNTANTGTSAYVGTDENFAMGQDVVLMKSPQLNGRYLNYILHGASMAQQLETLMVGSTFKRING
jgi:type I restriction enzyme S subunit